MKIDLSTKIEQHLQRLEDLAVETEENEAESFSSRATALNSLSTMLRELTKTQELIWNMQRMQKVERITIEVVKKYLSPEQCEVFLQDLETILGEPQP